MKYAIVKLGGKQYKVRENQEILFDRLDIPKDKKYDFQEILMIRTDSDVFIGKPYVNDARVTGKVIGEVKGEKITIAKYKSKVRYRRKIGFRPKYSKILIEKIEKGKKTKSTAKKSAK